VYSNDQFLGCNHTSSLLKDDVIDDGWSNREAGKQQNLAWNNRLSATVAASHTSHDIR
jgi:geranylgeranyl pyrophosphate synthase